MQKKDNAKVSCNCYKYRKKKKAYRKTDQKCDFNLQSSCGLFDLIARLINFIRCNDTKTRNMEF